MSLLSPMSPMSETSDTDMSGCILWQKMGERLEMGTSTNIAHCSLFVLPTFYYHMHTFKYTQRPLWLNFWHDTTGVADTIDTAAPAAGHTTKPEMGADFSEWFTDLSLVRVP